MPTAGDRSSPSRDRREGSDVSRPERATLGRRAGDSDPRTNVTTKVLVGVVAIINALYLVGESFINSTC
jgi:hypothetical protein